MMMIIKRLAFFAGITVSIIINAQNRGSVALKNYNDSYFIDFIKETKSNNNLHFFYNSTKIDSVKIKQQTLHEPIDQILKNTFKSSDYSILFNNQNYLITEKYKIDTTLPYYFTVGAFTALDEPLEIETTDFLKEDKKENKHENGIIKIGNPVEKNNGKKGLISGYIKEFETGEPIIGAVVYIDGLGIGTTTDRYGYYVLSVPKGRYDILYKFVGRKNENRKILVFGNGSLDVNLKEELMELKGVVITADKEHNVKGIQLGLDKLDINTVKQIPTSMGEVDLIKTAILLPGVQTVGEGASGFNVRGGSVDQNLILIDDSPIFNTSHLFGFFSVFNADVVREMKLYKSGIPAKYGSRISSVFDVSVKNGNRKEISGSGGISPITGKLCLEGPLMNKKGSFIVAGRSTYSDWILKRINKPEIKNSKASFYDVNAKFNYDINDDNSISTSFYISSDYFKLNSDTTYNYKNINASIDWKHTYTKKIYSIFSGIYSHYNYNISSTSNIYNGFDLTYDIDYKEFKTDFSYFPNVNHTINFGSSVIHYNLNPGKRVPVGSESNIKPQDIENENAIEAALFLGDEINVTNKISVYAGIRYSGFFVLGPKTVYKYSPNAPKSESSILDTFNYASNKLIKTWGGPEIRFSSRYQINGNTSFKISYNRGLQYLHMMTNTTAISPTDIWKISDKYIPPQKGDQYSIGFYKNINKNKIETSVEIYYKVIQDIIDYKPGTEFIINDKLETDILNGTGKAYGAEFLIKKKYGKLNGWISYTYSSTKIKVDGKFLEEKINHGNYFYADYDKPHDITVVSNYKFSRRISISNNITYSSGRPITMPIAKFWFRNRELVQYSDRNKYRIPDYFRWDVSLNLEGNLKRQKLAHSSLSLSVYNATGRDNVYSIFFISDPDKNIKAYKLSVFAQPIFTVTYNFKF